MHHIFGFWGKGKAMKFISAFAVNIDICFMTSSTWTLITSFAKAQIIVFIFVIEFTK